MASKNYLGQRLSFESVLCTVRYIGPVAGTEKDWLGVEWDDPTRGKHDGEHRGVKYFSCRSQSKTAASFIRPSRPADATQSFVSAVHSKYATATTDRRDALASDLHKEIIVSGKVAQEIGFEKIRVQMAQLDELKVVIVDGSRIREAETPEKGIRQVCPKIVELDLSRNLFETCSEIIRICKELDNLKSLSLNGNRLVVLTDELSSSDKYPAFSGIKDLSLDEVLLSWTDICTLTQYFTSLTTLSASSNNWSKIPSTSSLASRMKSLTSLTLEHNGFCELSDIAALSELPSLQRLHLKGNRIHAINTGTNPKPHFSSQLNYVDLSYNAVTAWSLIDGLPDVFPGLTGFRFSHNPIYTAPPTAGDAAISMDETYMITLSRLRNLISLNFTDITPAERTNAEMFYLSRIGKAIAEAPVGDEQKVISQHRRYEELCDLYGEPTVIRASTAINPDFLEARLVKFTFFLQGDTSSGQGGTVTKHQEIPKGFDIYQVKGIVGRLFNLKPMTLRLVWETGEWDPVAGYENEEENSDEEDSEARKYDETDDTTKEKGKWMRREVELEDSTRQVGFCIDGMEAKVRVELR